jgi:hypothetical protein
MTTRSLGSLWRVSLAAALLVATPLAQLLAGWSHRTHVNYIEEAVRILPYFDYLMCNYYLDHLLEGAVEGEFHFRFVTKGQRPAWLEGVKDTELKLVNGLSVAPEDIEAAATFFSQQFDELREDIVNAERRNADLMFMLGYYLHSLNNTLMPRSEAVGTPSAQYLAQHTDSLNLKRDNVEDIEDLRSWLATTIAKNLTLADEWTAAARRGDGDAFVSYAMRGNARNIYNAASIISYVLADTFGPEDPAARQSIVDIWDRRHGRGRRPSMESTSRRSGHTPERVEE